MVPFSSKYPWFMNKAVTTLTSRALGSITSTHMAVPVPEDSMSSSGFHGHQAYTWCIDTYVGKTSYGGLDEKSPHSLICLNVWSPVAGCVTLLEEECNWGVTFNHCQRTSLYFLFVEWICAPSNSSCQAFVLLQWTLTLRNQKPN